MSKTVKRILIPLFALCVFVIAGLLLQSDAKAATVVSGSYENTSWTLTDSGVLTISGTGEMCDYYRMYRENNNKSWSDFDVTKIIIREGITSVSDAVFSDCKLLETVSLPSTLTSIDGFSGCISLSKIVIPDKVTKIEERAFSGCTSLSSVTLPANLTQIGEWAFYNCSNLTAITLPGKLKIIDDYAFYLCPLHSVIIPSSVTVIGGDACTGGYKYSRVIFKGNAPSMESGSSFPFDVPYSYDINYNGKSPLYIYHPASATGWNIDDINDKYSVTGIAYLRSYAKPVITSSPKSTSVASGSTVTLSVTATEAGDAPLLYQWQYSSNGGKTWTNSTMAGYNTSSLPVKGIESRNGVMLRCVVDVLEPGLAPAYSSAAVLTVTGVKPAIRTQPVSASANLDATVNFTVKAYGSELKYQWYYSADGGSTWKIPSFTSNTATLSVTANAARNGLFFRCVVSNSVGSATSSSAKLTVIFPKPAVTTQPKAANVVLNGTAKFTVAASGGGLKYQWYYSADGGKTWKIPSFTSNTATISMTASSARNGLLFRCVVSNSAGSVTSSSAKLTLITKPTITTQPKAASVVLNGTAKFTIAASGAGLKYQWYYSADGGKTWKIPSFTSNTASISMTASSSRNGLLFRCVVSNSAGSATSSSAKLTVK